MFKLSKSEKKIEKQLYDNIENKGIENDKVKANKNNSFGLSDVIIIFILSLVVCYGWQLLEIIMVGEVKPNSVDSVIGIVLIYSLYGNYRYFKEKIKKAKRT